MTVESSLSSIEQVKPGWYVCLDLKKRAPAGRSPGNQASEGHSLDRMSNWLQTLVHAHPEGVVRRRCQKPKRSTDASENAPRTQSEATSLIEVLLDRGEAQFPSKGDADPDPNPKGLSDEFGSIIRAFEASMADLEAAAVSNVRSRLGTYLRNELRRVLKDASKSCEGPSGDSSLPVAEGGSPFAINLGTHRPHKTHKATTGNLSPENKPLTALDELLGVAAPQPADPPQQSQDPWVIPWSAGSEDYTSSPSKVINDSENPGMTRADGVFEGTVTLTTHVETSGVLQMVHFVAELRRRTEFRLMKLLQNGDGATEILLALREPVHVKNILLQIAVVSQVDDSRSQATEPHAPVLDVKLESPGEVLILG